MNEQKLFKYAEEILAHDLERYAFLKSKTINSSVLGNFIELRLTEWIKEHILNRLDLSNGHNLQIGNGFVVPLEQPEKTPRRGQCDIFLFESIPGTVLFKQNDLFVLKPPALWTIIECKANIDDDNGDKTLETALTQVNYLKNISKQLEKPFPVFLFIANYTLKEQQEPIITIREAGKSLGIENYPDSILLLNRREIIHQDELTITDDELQRIKEIAQRAGSTGILANTTTEAVIISSFLDEIALSIKEKAG